MTQQVYPPQKKQASPDDTLDVLVRSLVAANRHLTGWCSVVAHEDARRQIFAAIPLDEHAAARLSRAARAYDMGVRR